MSIAVQILSAPEGPIVCYEMVPADGVAQDEGVLLINSGPWDSMRLSWLQRQIMSNLSGRGYRVLRFDLCGTGESEASADAANWTRWVAECCIVRDSFRKTVRKVHVIGFRLGAALALKASEAYAFRSLHLIDPVLDGVAYWQELRNIQQSFVAQQNKFGANIHASEELFGFPLGAHWQTSLAALHPAQFDAKGRRAFLYSSKPDAPLALFAKQLQDKDWDVQSIPLNDDFAWNDLLKLHMQCFARETLLSISRAFEEL
jgi:pimeloyl-ACP methyl ester carboxylesterase